MSFADDLATYMSKTQLNQAGLSVTLGTSQSNVSRWLNGKATPSHATLRQLAEMMSASPEMIASWALDPPKSARSTVGALLSRLEAAERQIAEMTDKIDTLIATAEKLNE